MFDESKERIAIEVISRYAKSQFVLYQTSMERRDNAESFAESMEAALEAQMHYQKYRTLNAIIKDIESMLKINHEEEG